MNIKKARGKVRLSDEVFSFSQYNGLREIKLNNRKADDCFS